jgi:ATP-dependent DNA ligase
MWVHEIKHDGFRFICRRDGDRVRVFSRRGKDWTDKVPLIVEALLALPVTSSTLDGEGVVLYSHLYTLAPNSGPRGMATEGHLEGARTPRPWASLGFL